MSLFLHVNFSKDLKVKIKKKSWKDFYCCSDQLLSHPWDFAIYKNLYFVDMHFERHAEGINKLWKIRRLREFCCWFFPCYEASSWVKIRVQNEMRFQRHISITGSSIGYYGLQESLRDFRIQTALDSDTPLIFPQHESLTVLLRAINFYFLYVPYFEKKITILSLIWTSAQNFLGAITNVKCLSNLYHVCDFIYFESQSDRREEEARESKRVCVCLPLIGSLNRWQNTRDWVSPKTGQWETSIQISPTGTQMLYTSLLFSDTL